jgi:oxazoline/thiazoline synthase
MRSHPQLKSHFRYEVVPNVGVFLLSEQESILLNGTLYEKLIPLLTGQHSDKAITLQLASVAPAAHVYYAIGRLQKKGMITTQPSSMPSAQAAYWHLAEVDVNEIGASLHNTAVSLHPLIESDLTPFTTLLQAQSFQIAPTGTIAVIVTDDYLHPQLAAVNQTMLAEKRPFLLIKPVGIEPWVGPFIIPGETGCWTCLAARLQGLRKVETYLQLQSGDPSPRTTAVSALPSTPHIAYSIAATELSKWVVQHRSLLAGRILSLNTLTWQQQIHTLTKRPQCLVCGRPQLVQQQQERPLHLHTQRKQFIDDGGHRIQTPAATLAQLEAHISPITGIISRLNPISDSPITPAYAADHNIGWMHDDLYFLRESLRARTGGKGKSDTQARASAIGESIERYAGMFQGDEARTQARLADLPSAIHPNACMLFSDNQFAIRDEWNTMNSPFNYIPTRFDETAVTDWTPVWSLTDAQPRYLPTAYCFYGYHLRYNVTTMRPDSNGCAAGNSKEEAILQGFLELVERDGVALWWYSRMKMPYVNLTSFKDPYITALQLHYDNQGRELWVLDLTSDLGIPIFAALSCRKSDAAQIMMGFGAHLDAHIGVLRALTELNQMLPAVQSGMARSETALDKEVLRWWQTATVAEHGYLVGDETAVARQASDYPTLHTTDILADILNCVSLLKQHGMEMLLLDQTRPDTPLHVVKVIVPGLRHFWARFAPGRLYDVPVKIGWLSEPIQEHALNPHPMFL